MGGHQYVYTALVTFWTYDYACSLHEEWTFLLRSRWTKVKGLYIITRYIPFALITTHLWVSLTQDETPSTCQTLNNISACFAVMSLTCSECFFILRTYALWNNNKIVLVTMMSILFAIVVTFIGISFATNATSDVTTSTIPGVPGCSMSTQGVRFFLSFIVLFVFQLGLISLTLIRVIQSWRSAKGHLYAVVVKHNVYYYACGLLLSAVNVLVLKLISDSKYYSLLEDLQVLILAILATRMHLHLWHIDRHAHVSEAVHCTV
ncbi:hypothetical protein EDB19DRAFT_917767 [Suillus lakei]|nr:hypothetical protein EDB19DRAFT_917767 [Suillus lakei]